jgi:uncharacterized membrane protein YqhA
MAMEDRVKPIRFISIIAVVSSLFGALLMFIIGAAKTIRAYMAYFGGPAGFEDIEHLKAVDQAIAHLIRSIDAFLIALTLMIFTAGVFKLFIRGAQSDNHSMFAWINIDSVQKLKKILAELVVVILFVKFLEVALVNLDSLAWEMLVLPGSILLLALSIKFLELK